MGDKVLIIMVLITEVLSVYNFADALVTVLLHRTSFGKDGYGRVVRLSKAIRRDSFRFFLPSGNKPDSRDVRCDYLVDFEYMRPDGEKVFIKNFIVPAYMKLTAGSASPIFRADQTLPVKYSLRFKRMVVVSSPDTVGRQAGLFALVMWGAGAAVMTLFTVLALVL